MQNIIIRRSLMRQVYIDLGSANTKVVIKTRLHICNPFSPSNKLDDSFIVSDLYCDMNSSSIDQINADYCYLLLNNKPSHHHSYKQDNIICFKNIVKTLLGTQDDLIQFTNLPLIVSMSNKRNYSLYYVLLAYFKVLYKEIKRYFINILKLKDFNYQNTQLFLIQDENASEKQKAALIKVFNFAFGSQVDELKVNYKDPQNGLIYYMSLVEKMELKANTKISIIDCKNGKFIHFLLHISDRISISSTEELNVKNGKINESKLQKTCYAIGGNSLFFKANKQIKQVKYPKICYCLGYCQNNTETIKITGIVSKFFFGVETLIPYDQQITTKNIDSTLMEQKGRTLITNGVKILIKPGDYFDENVENFKTSLSILPSNVKDNFIDFIIHQFNEDEIEEYGEYHIYKGSSDPIGGFHICLDKLDNELSREERFYEIHLRLNPNLQGVVRRQRQNITLKTINNLELDCFTPLKFQFKSKRHTLFVVDASGCMNLSMKNIYEPVNFKNSWKNLFGAVIDRMILYLRNRQNYVDDIFSLIVFNQNAQVLLDKVQNIQLIFQKINNIQVSGQSDILAGIEACAQVQHKGDMKALSYEQVCIVFTDGDVVFNEQKAIQVKSKLEEDIDLHIVAFGDTDYTALNQMCETMNGKFHLSKDLDNLDSVFYFVATE